jgi:hypothetical protein
MLANLEMFKTHTFVGQNLYAINNLADKKEFLGEAFALAAMS